MHHYMKLTIVAVSIIVAISIFSIMTKFNHAPITGAIVPEQGMIHLPEPAIIGTISVEEAMQNRRSIRSFSNIALSPAELSQLLWAAQGMTEGSHRTTPSAGALYPLEIYVAIAKVKSISPGFYHYMPETNSLQYIGDGEIKLSIPHIAYNQDWIAQSAADIIIAAEYSRTEGKYGKYAKKYVHMEVGHAGQNVYLQAYALGLGTTIVAGFDNDKMKDMLNISYEPLAIMPVGRL